MNYYIVTEDSKGGVDIYKSWITLLNPALSIIERPEDAVENNVYIISGQGFPFYFKIIQDAISDVNYLTQYDELIIAVDSEEMTYNEKLAEMKSKVNEASCRININYIIQHFCIETWALGNRSIYTDNPQEEILKELVKHYNVKKNDPENLNPLKKYPMNRAQLSEKYLKKMLNEKYVKLTYTKRDSSAICNKTYLREVKSRYKNTSHIKSFEKFLSIFETV